MSEIALISARKSSLSNDIRHGSSTARIALKLANDPDKFLSTIQIGITLIGILTGIYSGDVLATDFGNILTDAGVPATYAYLLAQTLIVILVTYLTIIFGELVPKRIGMSASTRAAKLLARPMYWLSVIASPFVWILAKSTSLIFNLLHINTAEEKVTEEEIKSMIDEGTENGEVQEVEQDIVDRVFSLGDRSINTIMTYRSDIVSIDIDMNNKQLYDIVCQHLYQVYPVTQGNTLDNIIGVVYLKDLFGKLNSCEFNLRDVIRPAQYFHENMDVYKFYSGEEALSCIKSTDFDLAILDIMLPDISGLSICQSIRSKEYTYPVIMLTAKDGETDKITGLTLGADDYITKPFLPLELVARVKAQLRRYKKYNAGSAVPAADEIFKYAGLSMNIKTYECRLNGETLSLTPTEFSILRILFRAQVQCRQCRRIIP